MISLVYAKLFQHLYVNRDFVVKKKYRVYEAKNAKISHRTTQTPVCREKKALQRRPV